MEKFYNTATKILLLCSSVFFALLICEIAVRFLRPDLKNIVYGKYQNDRFRIYKNIPLEYNTYRHPDTGSGHLVIHNRLGLRQHRDIERLKKPDVIRIGFFGDSYTENLRIAAQYSFTEPLDYLLNKTGKKFEVLNFGTDGYGTDQEYLQYVDETLKYDLDIVVYVFCENDLKEIMANRLCYVDKNNNIQFRSYNRNFTYRIIKQFYITYLVIEAFKPFQELLYWDTCMNYQSYNHQRRKERFENRYESLLLERYGEGSKLSAACNLIRVLLKSWRSEADARGQLFLVALLPNKTPSINALIKTELDNLEVKYIDLFPFFVERQRESSKKNTIILNDKQVLKQFSLRILKHVKGKDASEGQTTQTNKIKETIQNLFYLIESHPDKEEIINLIDKSNQKKRKMAPGLTHLLENGKEERIIELIEGLIKRGQINEKYFFNTDKHWNEEGNKIASVFLMKFLAETLNLVEVDDQFIRCGLNEYYSSFDPKTDSGLWLEEGMIPEYLKRSIQQKYLSLEQYIAEATQ